MKKVIHTDKAKCLQNREYVVPLTGDLGIIWGLERVATLRSYGNTIAVTEKQKAYPGKCVGSLASPKLFV